ncbi:MAG: class I SAM-dependent methyltransferase [Pyrinomonadaceae bacterium]|nr:class I SAM-dependent methyltransferase [Pyrinomonadaceae bacterium]
MQQAPQVTPDRIFSTLTAYQHSAALKAGIDLELFTILSGGGKTAKEIAEKTGAAERGIRILADSLTIMGFLIKDNEHYSLTEESAFFLDKNSQAYFGGAAQFLLSDKQREGFADLTNAVKKGGSTVSSEGSLDPESPMWVKFARGMAGMMAMPAQMMAEKLGFEADRELKILDIAAGHGIFGIMIANKYKNAEIYALDWANVLQVASENAEKFGVADRHHLIEGSAFEVDMGNDYDVVLLTNFLHHFDVRTNIDLLKKIRAAMKDDGKLLTLEFVPNEDRISPPIPAMFPLVMLAGTPAGDAFTEKELNEMFEAAGFSDNRLIPLDPMPQSLMISTSGGI